MYRELNGKTQDRTSYHARGFMFVANARVRNFDVNAGWEDDNVMSGCFEFFQIHGDSRW